MQEETTNLLRQENSCVLSPCKEQPHQARSFPLNCLPATGEACASSARSRRGARSSRAIFCPVGISFPVSGTKKSLQALSVSTATKKEKKMQHFRLQYWNLPRNDDRSQVFKYPDVEATLSDIGFFISVSVCVCTWICVSTRLCIQVNSV